MNFKFYEGCGRHFPKCRVCNKTIIKGDGCFKDKGYYYCVKCGEVVRIKRVAYLESLIIKVKFGE